MTGSHISLTIHQIEYPVVSAILPQIQELLSNKDSHKNRLHELEVKLCKGYPLEIYHQNLEAYSAA